MNKQQIEVINYVEELYDMGRRSLDDLHDEEKSVLTGLIIRSKNRFDQWDFINETNYDDLPLDLASMLHNKYLWNTESIIDRLKYFAIEHASDEINQLFESHHEKYQEAQKDDYERHASYDPDMTPAEYSNQQ